VSGVVPCCPFVTNVRFSTFYTWSPFTSDITSVQKASTDIQLGIISHLLSTQFSFQGNAMCLPIVITSEQFSIHEDASVLCWEGGRLQLQHGNRPYSMKILLVFFITSRQILWFSISNFAMFPMLYSLLWVIPGRLTFICRHFGTHCLFQLRRWCKLLTTPMKMEQTVCSETSAPKIQTPGNHPQQRIKHIMAF